MKLFLVGEFSEIESEPTASFVPTILNPFSKKKKKAVPNTRNSHFLEVRER